MFRPALEDALVNELQREANLVGIPLATYTDLLVSEAHGYRDGYLPQVDTELPTRVAMDELRDTVSSLDVDDCTPVHRPNSRQRVRLERPLATVIDARCRDMGVEYSAYLRAVLRHAAGMPDGHPGYEQQAMPLEPHSRGDRMAS